MKQKKEKVKGRTTAILCMVLAIVLSMPVGTCVSLNREREQAQEAYYGSDEVFGLMGDLSACQGEAMNLITLGEKYLPAGDATLKDVETADFDVESAASPRGKALAFEDLCDAVDSLYRVLEQEALSAQDEKYRVAIYADFYACADMMRRRAEEYNTDAEAFNAMLQEAPGRSLAAVFGVRELEPFA